MLGRSSVLRPKAWISLWIMVVLVLYVGMLVGTWILPFAMTVLRGGHSIKEIQVEAFGFARAPAWLDEQSGFLTAKVVDVAGIILGFLFIVRGGRALSGQWRVLVVRWGWATQEELTEYYKRGERV